MKKPVIQLKNIKYAEFASQETNCYAATVYVDGKPFAHVSNEGMGGSDSQHPIKPFTHKDLEELEKRIAATFPKNVLELEGGDEEFDESLEGVCADLMADYLYSKEAKRILKRVSFVKGKTETDIYYMGKVKDNGGRKLVYRSQIKRKYPNAVILNDLDLPKVVELLKGKSIAEQGAA